MKQTKQTKQTLIFLVTSTSRRCTDFPNPTHPSLLINSNIFNENKVCPYYPRQTTATFGLHVQCENHNINYHLCIIKAWDVLQKNIWDQGLHKSVKNNVTRWCTLLLLLASSNIIHYIIYNHSLSNHQHRLLGQVLLSLQISTEITVQHWYTICAKFANKMWS